MRVAREVDLQKPNDVEKFIYELDVSNNYKNKLFLAYQYACDANGIPYRKPKRLTVQPYVIYVPTEERIDKIIATCGWVYSTVFSLSKYGLRPDEIAKLTFKNIDLENRNLTVPTSKLGAPINYDVSSPLPRLFSLLYTKHIVSTKIIATITNEAFRRTI